MSCTSETCDNPTDLSLCGTCVRDLQAWIDRVPEMRQVLFTTMAKLDATAPRNSEGGGGGSTGSAMPLRDNAMDARYALSFWEGADASSLAHDQYAGNFLPMLRELIDKAERIVDNPTERKVFGKCGADECEALLVAEPDAVWVNCPECEAPHNVQERDEDLRRKAKGEPRPPREVREYLAAETGINISAKDFENWVQHRKFPHVLDHVGVAEKPRDRGRRLYFPGDVFRVYESMKERRRIPA